MVLWNLRILKIFYFVRNLENACFPFVTEPNNLLGEKRTILISFSFTNAIKCYGSDNPFY